MGDGIGLAALAFSHRATPHVATAHETRKGFMPRSWNAGHTGSASAYFLTM